MSRTGGGGERGGDVFCAHLHTCQCGGAGAQPAGSALRAQGLPVDCALISMGLHLRHPIARQQPPAT
jgi:hypothetical protein